MHRTPLQASLTVSRGKREDWPSCCCCCSSTSRQISLHRSASRSTDDEKMRNVLHVGSSRPSRRTRTMSVHSAYMIEFACKARLPFDQRIRKEVEEAKCFLANHDFYFPARASTCTAQCTELDHTRAMPGCYRSMNTCTKKDGQLLPVVQLQKTAALPEVQRSKAPSGSLDSVRLNMSCAACAA